MAPSFPELPAGFQVPADLTYADDDGQVLTVVVDEGGLAGWNIVSVTGANYSAWWPVAVRDDGSVVHYDAHDCFIWVSAQDGQCDERFAMVHGVRSFVGPLGLAPDVWLWPVGTPTPWRYQRGFLDYPVNSSVVSSEAGQRVVRVEPPESVVLRPQGLLQSPFGGFWYADESALPVQLNLTRGGAGEVTGLRLSDASFSDSLGVARTYLDRPTEAWDDGTSNALEFGYWGANVSDFISALENQDAAYVQWRDASESEWLCRLEYGLDIGVAWGPQVENGSAVANSFSARAKIRFCDGDETFSATVRYDNTTTTTGTTVDRQFTVESTEIKEGTLASRPGRLVSVQAILEESQRFLRPSDNVSRLVYEMVDSSPVFNVLIARGEGGDGVDYLVAYDLEGQFYRQIMVHPERAEAFLETFVAGP